MLLRKPSLNLNLKNKKGQEAFLLSPNTEI